MGVVECTTYIGQECAVTHCVVFAAVSVGKQGERSNARVFGAGGVTEKRPRANGRIFASGVDQERHGADTSVEVSVGVAKEGVKTKRRVVYTGG